MLLPSIFTAFVAVAGLSPQVLVMDLEAVGVADDEANAATRVVAAAADDVDGIVVVSTADLRRLAELEGAKANVGCASDTSCLADLAGALGADRVLFGSMSRLGSTTTVALSLYEVSTQQSWRRSFDVVDTARLAPLLRANTTALLTGVTVAAPASPNIVPLVAGVGAVVVGGGTAGLMEALIQDKGGDGDTKETLRIIGLAGVGVAAVGVAVAVVGAVVFFGGEQ